MSDPTIEAKAHDPLAYQVSLPQFEGPLDLLLHLIQTHELSILDIPMKFITEKYLEYLSLMRALTIDLASEYLVMAAVLTHIKSKMLLPEAPKGQDDAAEEEELDPREELVRRLLEYQKFKQAAAELQDRGTLGQDVFTRPELPDDAPKEVGPLASFPVFQLLDAFSKLLERRKIKVSHEISFDKLTITDRIAQISELLQARGRLAFEDLFDEEMTRGDLVITFLSLLEMGKMRLVRLFQSDTYGGIYLEAAVTSDVDAEADAEADLAPRAPRPQPSAAELAAAAARAEADRQADAALEAELEAEAAAELDRAIEIERARREAGETEEAAPEETASEKTEETAPEETGDDALEAVGEVEAEAPAPPTHEPDTAPDAPREVGLDDAASPEETP
ncbi:MAG: segregation/condensation protein A [Polyangiaceae bacterium]|nr:segregation/condensation protein A [Polyangiaceae bacterium]